MEWLGEIDRADKLISDWVLYFFSLLAFALLPAHFGRKVWVLPAWFLGLNAVFLLGLWEGVQWENPLIFAALGQLPWLLFMLDLLFRGKLSGKVAAVPMREYLLWNTTRLMGVHYFLAVYGGHVPEEFAMQVGISEMVTGLGALLLFIFFKPESGLYRTLVIFWNTYGLTSALVADWRVFHSNPYLPFARYSKEIFQYMAAYPQNWLYCFWFPIAIGMHAAIFYKLYIPHVTVARDNPAPAGENA